MAREKSIVRNVATLRTLSFLPKKNYRKLFIKRILQSVNIGKEIFLLQTKMNGPYDGGGSSGGADILPPGIGGGAAFSGFPGSTSGKFRT